MAQRRCPSWSDLPEGIAEDILWRAFLLDGSSVAAWCRLYLVCKCDAAIVPVRAGRLCRVVWVCGSIQHEFRP